MQRLRWILAAALVAVVSTGCQSNPFQDNCPDGRCGVGGGGGAAYGTAVDDSNSVQPVSYTSGAGVRNTPPR